MLPFASKTETKSRAKSTIEILFRLVLLATVAFASTSYAARTWWVADIFANLRIQWCLSSICCAAVFCLLKKWHFFGCSILAIFISSIPIATSDLAAPTTARSSVEISVASVNVLSSNLRHVEIEQQIIEADADVVAVLELTSQLSAHFASGSLRDVYPFAMEVPQDLGNFGIGLYSKTAWKSAEVVQFNDSRIHSILSDVIIDTRQFRIVATHTLPPIGSRNFDHRNTHLSQLASKAREWANQTNVIVIGDLNITPWSPVLRDTCNKANLRRIGSAFTPTWYRFDAFPFGLVLDHVLVSENLSQQSCYVAEDVGSDHRLVFAKLSTE